MGAATDLLKPGEVIKLFLIAEIDPQVADFPLENQTSVTGEGLDFNGNAITRNGASVVAADISDSGSDLDGDNPSEPGDNGTPDDPTEFTCRPANIDITGEPAGICEGESVSLSVNSDLEAATYRWRYVGSSTVIAVGPNPIFNNLTTTTDIEVTITNNFRTNGFINQNCANPFVAVDGAVAYQTVTFSATDFCGRSATCTALVVIVDTDGPVSGFTFVGAFLCVHLPCSDQEY